MTTQPLKPHYIIVPICNDCGLPHVGRKNSDERCWCDTVGNWHWGEIQKEAEARYSLVKELREEAQALKEENKKYEDALKRIASNLDEYVLKNITP